MVLWLDLANTYGSIPHKLIETTVDHHQIPSKIKDLILNYYRNSASEWHQLEKGIITRCTISGILFALAMNMVVKATEVECRGPLSKSGIQQPPIRAFMDGLTVIIISVLDTPGPGKTYILGKDEFQA